MTTATPVRIAHPDPGQGRYTLLRAVESTYRDGAEETLLDMVRGSEDLGSLNEDLHGRAEGWAQRYHVDRQRANVLRAFELSGATRVLEVGAGCGAMSRYLAETCTAVDALEPVQARAAVAAARLRDLPGARVFAGELADLPDEPSYDLIVVIGVLEYVGGGTAVRAPYLDFLDQISRRLLPGGQLLLAIENKLGVKYFAGSPEDHSDRAYDSLEGYPVGSPARTFDRAALADLFRDAGLAPRFFSAFPDYKLTRAVMADELMTDPSGLAARLPRFPSPDWQTARDYGPNEELLWRTLVEAGQAGHFGNSFVVVAEPGPAAAELWPARRQAAFYTTERRPGRSTETVVDREDGGLTLHRRVLGTRRDEGGPTHRVTGGPVLPGVSLVERLALDDDPTTVGGLLKEWQRLVAESAQDADGVALDLVPHNLLLDESGRLAYIDDEWRSTDWSPDDVVARGLIWLAERLSATPSPWQSRASRRALADELARLIDFPPTGEWLSAAVRREAELQVQLLRVGPGDPRYAGEVDRTAAELAHLQEAAMRPLRPTVNSLVAEREAARAELAAVRRDNEERQAEMREDITRTHAALAAAHEELGSIHGSLGFRAVVGLRNGVDRIAPGGTRRRALYERASAGLQARRRS
ncbi:SAM-dependent methyltransferase [Blastococcus tunisiensis]|uniref:SAM-dependent methyltransferase n=1 Tax=Blastococcus tunisiensis TaxID=1798228 RepID=UPI000B81F402|nr:class I SAM-dependent methyltransferase [Blastococcus sp. DSM 46838]